MLVFFGGTDASANCLAASVQGNMIEGTETAINAVMASFGVDSRVFFGFSENAYVGDWSPSETELQRGSVVISDDEDNDFRFSGQLSELKNSNDGFDFSAVGSGSDFSGQPLGPDPCGFGR